MKDFFSKQAVVPENPTTKPQRANVPNPSFSDREKTPFTTAVVPPGSAFGKTVFGQTQVFDTATGEPLPGVTVFETP